LGWALFLLGRYAEARSAIDKGVAECHRLELPAARWAPMRWIAAGAHLGQYEEAKRECRAYVDRCRELGRPYTIAQALTLAGWIDLAIASYHEAWQRGQESLTFGAEPRPGLWHEFSAASVSGYAARGLGQPERARSFLRQALQAAIQAKAVPPLIGALPGVALLLADQGQAEHAVEAYALACRYPYVANSCWFEDVVGRHIDAAAATLSEDVVATARERGCSLDLWPTAEALLAELGP
jgi:tetratricopeptide (TPR) repeat protein